MTSPRTLTFVTRRNCRLCEEAAPIVDKYARRAGFAVAIVDVDSVDELVGRYGERVPVLLDESGAVLVEGRFEGAEVKTAVAKARSHG